jgi:hypothetical protein
MLLVSLVTLTCAMSLVLPATSAEFVLSHYRGVTLGDSVQVVVARLKMTAAYVKVVQERPTVVQELTWRPHPFISGATAGPDALSEMVLTFHGGLLARIAVTYDRDRTQGLTDADLHDALGSVYGVSLLVGTPTQPIIISPSPERQTIGRWEDADTLLLLWREQYPTRVGLTITSIASDRALQEALADGGRLHAAEAPMRDLARRTADAAALEAREEKIRRDNKAAFKP